VSELYSDGTASRAEWDSAMHERPATTASRAFESITRRAQFRDRIAVRVTATPEAVFKALHEVTLPDMKLAWLLGEIRYLPVRLRGRRPVGDRHRPFFSVLIDGGTLVLVNDEPHEIITGSAGRLHQVLDQTPVPFTNRDAFERFDEPGYEKLFMCVRVLPSETPGTQWLVLDHATEALSADAERGFRRYWRVIKPAGAFVSRQLLKAVRDRAEGRAASTARARTRGMFGRAVSATSDEARQHCPGDELIPQPLGTLTHAITIRRRPADVWPWIVQMGAGSRAGWYSYDFLDNGRRPSATEIRPDLQRLTAGMVFQALPDVKDGFVLLAFVTERYLVLGWRGPGGTVRVTWTFILREIDQQSTRLIVRARAAAGYRFHGLPWWLSRHLVRVVHFAMQRKQLLGIARRAESGAPHVDRAARPQGSAA
jgi:hypothetical protein